LVIAVAAVRAARRLPRVEERHGEAGRE